MEPALIADAHIYVAIFRCERCNQPVTSHVISQGHFPDCDLMDRPFYALCECKWSAMKRGSEAIHLFPIEWSFGYR
jgi:hypothetical protein